MSCQLAGSAGRFVSGTSLLAVVAVTVAACGSAAGHAASTRPQAARGATAAHVIRPAAAPLTAARVPKFFIDNVLFSGNATGAGSPQVRSTATGALMAQYPGLQAQAIAPVSGHAFVIARLAGACSTELYRAALSDSGRLGKLVRVGPELHGEIAGMTADADGNAVGFTAWDCAKAVSGSLAVLNLRTGKLRRWRSVSVDGEPGLIAVGALSMSADGRLLAFDGSTVAAGRGTARQGVWVLKTGSPAGNLADRSRRVLSTRATGLALGSVILTPGGTSFYLCKVTTSRSAVSAQIAAYRVTDGGLIRTIARLTSSGQTVGCPMAADPSGTELLVAYSLHAASKPGVGPLVRLARLGIASRSVTRISFRLPGSGGMSVADGISIAW
jgi:hypothetical protein